MTSYYGKQAYSPDNIPQQPAAQKRPWLLRFANQPLPWGSTEPVAPSNIFDDYSPQKMHEYHAQRQQFENAKAAGTAQRYLEDEHNDWNHQYFRFAKPKAIAQLWYFLYAVGKVGATTATYWALIPTFLFMAYISGEVIAPFTACLYIWVPTASCWLIGYLFLSVLPFKWAQAIGPLLWELNRRTGVVTIFNKNGSIKFQAPFWEFDAYLNIIPTRAGTPMYKLYLAHRYQDQAIDFGGLAPVGMHQTDLFAVWDLLQNYMDSSQPLPDIPLFENHRKNDPVTSAYDRQTGRKATYWYDMSDSEWQKQCKQMQQKRATLNTVARPNLMARYVDYAS